MRSVRRSQRAFARTRQSLLLAAAIAFVFVGFDHVRADNSREILFESSSLRIYRIFDTSGIPSVILTNLDCQGERLAPEEFTFDTAPRRAPSRPAEAAVRNEAAAPETTPIQKAGPVTVEVRDGDEVRDLYEVQPEGDGTTIIININNTPPAPAPPVAPLYFAPVLAYGGLAGSFRYPDQQPFLGYGTGIRSRSMFGGLSLNAGNNFGLKTGVPCSGGFDCMSPPPTNAP